MWVRLQSIQYVSVNAKQETYYPGEWVNVGKQLATSWIISGQADRPDIAELALISDAGVQITDEDYLSRGKGIFPGISMESAPLPLILYPRSLMWNGKVEICPEYVATGFTLLKSWELAIPIWDYNELARDIGSDSDRRKAAAIIHDLRVPCYNPFLFYARKCERVEQVLVKWVRSTITDKRLALLCAIYEVKPLVLALPTTWGDTDGGIK